MRIPWNKGKTGIYSEETKRKMGMKNIGRVAWNKNKTFSKKSREKMSISHTGLISPLKGRIRSDIPWNKGKFEWKPCKGCAKAVRKWQIYCSQECYSKFPKSIEVRRRLSLSGLGKHKGKKSSSWKGGITPKEKILRQKFAQEIRNIVLERDNYTCKECGRYGGILHVAHVKPWSLYPELRFDINNCRTLCIDCHYLETHGKSRPINSKWGLSGIPIRLEKGVI